MFRKSSSSSMIRIFTASPPCPAWSGRSDLQRYHLDRGRLALQGDLAPVEGGGPAEELAERQRRLRPDQDLVGDRGLHEARRDVHGIPDDGVAHEGGRAD